MLNLLNNVKVLTIDYVDNMFQNLIDNSRKEIEEMSTIYNLPYDNCLMVMRNLLSPEISSHNLAVVDNNDFPLIIGGLINEGDNKAYLWAFFSNKIKSNGIGLAVLFKKNFIEYLKSSKYDEIYSIIKPWSIESPKWSKHIGLDVNKLDNGEWIITWRRGK